MASTFHWSINLNPARLSATMQPDELYAHGDRAVRDLQALGVSFVRVDLRWAMLFPEPGDADTAAVAWYHHFLLQLRTAGIQIYAILYNPPAWACALSERDLGAFHAAWRDYVRFCATEFEGIALWQVWNEPNNYVSHLKDDFNLFHTRTFSLGGWKATLPVGVNWKALAPLFRIARQELPKGALIAYNVIASVSDFTPVTYPGWTEWDHFTDQLLERVGDCIDVIALDHYPDTWVPGSGPLSWEPLDLLARKVHDPACAWYGKTVVIGEFGYSSCRNVDLVRHPTRIRFFPEDHSEETMAEWYASVLPHLQARMAPEKWPHNRLHLANVYELYDAKPGEILGGDHAEVIGLEYHFGLMRHTGEPKSAFALLQGQIRGDAAEATTSRRRTPTNPLGLYMKGSAASKAIHRRVSPMIYALYQALRPPLRRHDAGVVSMGAALVLYQLWRNATRSAAK